jgi:hypothetical protein
VTYIDLSIRHNQMVRSVLLKRAAIHPLTMSAPVQQRCWSDNAPHIPGEPIDGDTLPYVS